MKSRFVAVAFDVIETVFSLEPLRHRLTSAGLPAEALEIWFSQTLRDAFALEVTEVYRPFREVASGTLTSLLAQHELSVNQDTITHILDGLGELSPHPDAESAFSKVREAGIRIATLTNGSADATGKLLRNAGLDQYVEQIISVEELRHWKPRREVYLHAARRLDVEPRELALVATHPWDVHGAACAGLATAFVSRGKIFPSAMVQPDSIGETLVDAVTELMRIHA